MSRFFASDLLLLNGFYVIPTLNELTNLRQAVRSSVLVQLFGNTHKQNYTNKQTPSQVQTQANINLTHAHSNLHSYALIKTRK